MNVVQGWRSGPGSGSVAWHDFLPTLQGGRRYKTNPGEAWAMFSWPFRPSPYGTEKYQNKRVI
jgi:hypothetical protein